MNRLDELFIELDKVKSMTEEEVCIKYNADSKSEILADIYEEITVLEEDYGYQEDDGMDYAALLDSQGLSYAAYVKC